MTHILWQIDDHHQWLSLSEATVDEVEGWEFRGFLHPEDAIAEYRDGGPRPTAILMDYYLGGTYGDQVAEIIRELDDTVIIIGHSSVPSCSERIVLAGGNITLPKRSGAEGINPHLLEYLKRW